MPQSASVTRLAPKEVTTMTLGRKDFAATLLTVLAVFTFFATHEGWNVWLLATVTAGRPA
jgi:hypothetical protein